MRPPTTGNAAGGGQSVMFADQLVQHHPHHHHHQHQHRQQQQQQQRNGHANGGQRAAAQTVQNYGYYYDDETPPLQHQNGHSAAYGNLRTDEQHHQQQQHHHPVGSPPAQRCQCCPFGYHIDLDFVKFAEDVAAGKEQIQNWSSPAKKRARRLIASPSSERTLIADLSDSDQANISLPSSQHYNDASLLMSKSLDVDELPDLAADHHSQYNHHHHQQQQQQAKIHLSSASPYTVIPTTTTANGRPRAPSAPITVQQSIQHKNNPAAAYMEWESKQQQFPAYRTAPIPIKNNNNRAAPTESYQHETHHHLYLQPQHQSRFYEAHVQQQREQHKRHFPPHQQMQLSDLPERRDQSGKQFSAASISPPPYPVGSPLRTSTPRSLNDELQHILLMQQRQQQHQSHPLHISTTMPSYHIDRHAATNGARADAIVGGTTSAPSSPIPKRPQQQQQHYPTPSYQTSIAQSMAQLRKSPQKALATTTWSSTPQAHTSLSALSSAARNAVINPPSGGSASLMSSSSIPQQQQPRQQQHHYLESGRRRVLSPEPRHFLPTSQFSADNGGAVRSSNMQNRAFFHQNHGNSQSNLTNGTRSEMQNVNRVPYRTRGATSVPQQIGNANHHLAASSLELGEFASVVRRRRLDADLGGGGGSTTMLHSAHLVRSLSPPPMHYPHVLSSPSSGVSTTSPLTRQQHKTTTSLSMANLPVHQHQQQQQFYEFGEDNNGTLKATKATKMARNQFAHIPAQLPQNRNVELRSFATQTEMEAAKKRPALKEIGILTERQKPHELTSIRKQKQFKEIGTSPAIEYPLVVHHSLTSPADELPFHGLITYSSIGVDTADLSAGHLTEKAVTKLGKQKTAPPAPPPKPRGPDVEAELRRQRQQQLLSTLVTEFQYCVGHEPEYRPGEEPTLPERDKSAAQPDTVERGVDAISMKPTMSTISTSTTDLQKPTPAKMEIGIGTPQRHFSDIGMETDEAKPAESMAIGVQTEMEQIVGLELADTEIQTEMGWLEAEIDRRLAEVEAERREKRKRNSVERSTETDEDDAPDQFIMITCNKCEQRSSVASDELFEKIVAPPDGEEEMETTTMLQQQQEQLPMEIMQLPSSMAPPAPLFQQQQQQPQVMSILETVHEEDDHLSNLPQHDVVEGEGKQQENDDDDFEVPIGRKVALSAEPHGVETTEDKLLKKLQMIEEQEELENRAQEILEGEPSFAEIEVPDQIEKPQSAIETAEMPKEHLIVEVQELRRATTEIHSTTLFFDETANMMETEEERIEQIIEEQKLPDILLQTDNTKPKLEKTPAILEEKPMEHGLQHVVVDVEHSLMERSTGEEIDEWKKEEAAALKVLEPIEVPSTIMPTIHGKIEIAELAKPQGMEQRQQSEQEQRVEQSNVQACSPLSSDEGLVLAEEEEEFAQESQILPELELDADRMSIETDVQTVIFVESAAGSYPATTAAVGPLSSSSSTTMSSSKTSETPPAVSARTEALRKLLTEPQRRQPFQRDSDANRSYRSDKGKAQQLNMEYIAERHKSTDAQTQQSEPSTPCGLSSAQTRKALKETISLKKSPPPSLSSPTPGTSAVTNIALPPDPIPARIPRPKIARYSPNVAHAETPDEEEEAADRLTPLRSEMRSLTAWGGSTSPQLAQRALIFRTQIEGPVEEEDEDDLDAFERANCSGISGVRETAATVALDDGTSSTSSEGARTYDMSDEENADFFELSNPLRDALETINEFLHHGTKTPTKAAPETEQQLQQQNKQIDWAFKYAQHEWLKMSTRKNANAEMIEQFIDALESYSVQLMDTVLNMTDPNGNTALHYAVSNENFDVVSVLLDSKVCRVDRMNKAGYSALMLGALCELRNETECAIMQRLYQMGNVNAKAVKHAQTALMLASSHGRIESTNLLLKCGADVNIQDVDGSTALMCAAEHGQREIVKILLKQPNIDASLTDCDNQTALSIAVENQHRDIGVLIYAHLNFSRLTETSGENSVTI